MILVKVSTEVVTKAFIGYSIVPFQKWMLIPNYQGTALEGIDAKHLVSVRLREMFPGSHINPVTIIK
jgi:hypothetical protein